MGKDSRKDKNKKWKPDADFFFFFIYFLWIITFCGFGFRSIQINLTWTAQRESFVVWVWWFDEGTDLNDFWDFYRNSNVDTQAGWTNQQQEDLMCSDLPLFTTITSSSLHHLLCGDKQQNFRLSVQNALPLILCFYINMKWVLLHQSGWWLHFLTFLFFHFLFIFRKLKTRTQIIILKSNKYHEYMKWKCKTGLNHSSATPLTP